VTPELPVWGSPLGVCASGGTMYLEFRIPDRDQTPQLADQMIRV
jgi:hypothetical protein